MLENIDGSAFRRAATALQDAMRVGLEQRGAQQPYFRKAAARERQDNVLAHGATQARLAELELRGIEHQAVEDVRAGVLRVAEHLDEWRTISSESERSMHGKHSYQTYHAAEGIFQRLVLVADGLDAADHGNAVSWLAHELRNGEPRSVDRLAAARIVADARPGAFGQAELLIPSRAWETSGPHLVEDRLATVLEAGDERRPAAFREVWDHLIRWGDGTDRHIRAAPTTNGVTQQRGFDVGMLRELFDMVAVVPDGAPVRRPRWLDAREPTTSIPLDPSMRAELDMLARATSRADVERIVDERYRSPDRFLPHSDPVASYYVGSLRLPDDLRPTFSPSFVRDMAASERGAYDWWQGVVARRRAEGASASRILFEMLQVHDRPGSVANAIRTASTLVDELPTDGPRAPLVAELRRLAHENRERIDGRVGYASHPDYAEHGRMVAIAELLARMDETAARRSPAAAAPLRW